MSKHQNRAEVQAAANDDPAAAVNPAEALEAREEAQTTPAAVKSGFVLIPSNPSNRFNSIFEGIHFAVSKSGRVYMDNDGKGPGSSMALATVLLTYVGGFAGTPGKIYGRKAGEKAPVTADFSFVGSRQSQGLEALDTQAQAELAEAKGAIVDHYLAWRKQTGIKGTGKPIKLGDAANRVIEDVEF